MEPRAPMMIPGVARAPAVPFVLLAGSPAIPPPDLSGAGAVRGVHISQFTQARQAWFTVAGRGT